MNVQFGQMAVTYSARGIPSFQLEMAHEGLKKHRIIKGESEYIVKQKARLQAEEWIERWAEISEKTHQRSMKAEGKRQQERRKLQAADMTAAASEELDHLASLLKATLKVDDTVQWESLKDRTPFPEPAPVLPAFPAPPVAPKHPAAPTRVDDKYTPKLGFLDMIIPSRKKQLLAEADQHYASDMKAWQSECGQLDRVQQARMAKHAEQIEAIKAAHAQAMLEWQVRNETYLKLQHQGHLAIDEKRSSYQAKEPGAILDYCELVLASSRYPDYFPQEFELEYDEPSRTLLIDYQLPAPDDMPTLKAVRYIAARDELEESHISESQKTKLYDDVLYQVALRSIHEIMEADAVDAIESVVFNGIVTAIDRTTGRQATACVLSVRAAKPEFMAINLGQVDPRACFKALKGVGSAKLSGLSPIAPVMQMRREDGRFISAYEVANTLDDSVNLAAMDWEDFEHLIREVFEKEFTSTGGEVKVSLRSLKPEQGTSFSSRPPAETTWTTNGRFRRWRCSIGSAMPQVN